MVCVSGTFQAQVLWTPCKQGYRLVPSLVPVTDTIPWEHAKTIPILGLSAPLWVYLALRLN